MSIQFDGRVAVVTGAGAGLGKAHAMLLASLGAKVVVNDPGASLDGHGNSSSSADQVVEAISAADGTAVANYDRVDDREGAKRIVQTAIDHFGRIDILVNNAGILRDKTFAKMDLDDFELVLKVHFLGSVYTTHAAWPHMRDQGYGRIVFTASPAGLIGSFGQSNYSAAKTAMIGLMNNLKNEGDKSGIRINIISPVAGTRMTENVLSPEMFARQTPEAVSPAVGWLASEACDFSGEIIVASAGYFGAVRFMKSEGAQLGHGAPATVDELEAARHQILNFGAPAPFIATLDDETKKAVLAL